MTRAIALWVILSYDREEEKYKTALFRRRRNLQDERNEYPITDAGVQPFRDSLPFSVQDTMMTLYSFTPVANEQTS